MPSSVVAGIHYYPSTRILRVIFVSGTIYDYLNVPEKVYAEMKTAFSKGTYLNKSIKGFYKYKKVN
jgi:hypothetical protein